MSRVDRYTAKEYCMIMRHMLIILPAVCLGIVAMISGGISPVLWGQQPAAWIVLTLLALPLQSAVRRVPDSVLSVVFLMILTASLFGEAADGARRWLDLGIFNVNAAMLVLPAMLGVLCNTKFPYTVLMGAVLVLAFQPDVSQLTAFSAAALPILWQHRHERLRTTACILVLAASLIRCLLFPAAVAPVEYCEGILTMLAGDSLLLMFVGVAALLAIPAYFTYQFFRLRQQNLPVLAVYYAVTLIFIIGGEYPVPFMGFGLSPIAGYCLAYSCSAAITRD